MDKNWLIRTKNNHILGPVSKEKVRDLISNGSIKGDDEICSGDGYWLYIRETELVAKYILGDCLQGFNPVQEAKTVLSPGKNIEPKNDEEDMLPAGNDLEYPDMSKSDDVDVQLLPENDDLEYPGDTTSDDITMVSSINTSGDKNIDVRSSDSNEDVASLRKKKIPKKVNESSNNPPRLKKKPKQKNIKKKELNKSLISLKMIYVCVVIFFLVAVVSFYFRKSLFSEFMNKVSSVVVFPSAHAQVLQSKKKNGLITRL
jgi:hypothetical protein